MPSLARIVPASTMTALALLVAACATNAPPPSTVRIVAETGAAPAAEAAPPAVEPLAAPAAPAEAAAPADPIDAVDQPPTTSESLERAIALTVEGLRLYEGGEHEAAYRHLTDARIILIEAELPEAMQERGLTAIHGVLPDDLRHLDPEGVVAGLELELDASAAELAERAYVERQVRRILRRFDATAPEPRYLAVFVDEVTQYIRFYQGHHREFFERAFARKHKYWPTITAVFEPRGIPEELGYMALVESGFNPRAYSHAGARGVWQFIPSTGRRYQLRGTDDFYDVTMATEAAAEYLLDLISIFGSRSFLLAVAAYNGGETRVQRCLRELDDPFGKRSFWEIRGCLARETREYVPRIIAAAVIGSDPRRFGFDLAGEDEMRAGHDVVVVPNPAPLDALAARAGTSVADLRAANTDLAARARSTPVRNFPLYVPKGGGEALRASLAAAPPPAEPASPPATATASTYRVRRGDTLSEIAALHGVSYRDLARWNGLSSPYRLQVGQTLTVRDGGGGSPRVVYTVKLGNTLETIADIFAVRYRDIMRWNDLRSSRLQVGQQLVVHPPRPVRVETYRVRNGDTVAEIARRFGVPVRDVLTANGLGARTLIRPGQRLTIYVA
jgi:membrane-bound lytic murein transglycosylase D